MPLDFNFELDTLTALNSGILSSLHPGETRILDIAHKRELPFQPAFQMTVPCRVFVCFCIILVTESFINTALCCLLRMTSLSF